MGKSVQLEERLIDRCRRGDERAEFELYERYAGAMFSTCMRMLNDAQEAQDVLQESFITAFRKIDQFKHKSTFGAWLKRIVINQCIDTLQRNKRLRWETLKETEEQAPEQEVEWTITPEMLDKAIKALPAGCRAVFTLKALEGYDHQGIARTLKISVSTSKSQYFRAKQLLRTSLTKIMVL